MQRVILKIHNIILGLGEQMCVCVGLGGGFGFGHREVYKVNDIEILMRFLLAYYVEMCDDYYDC